MFYSKTHMLSLCNAPRVLGAYSVVTGCRAVFTSAGTSLLIVLFKSSISLLESLYLFDLSFLRSQRVDFCVAF